MAAAGAMRCRLRFEKRAAPVEDGYGNTVSGSWTAQFTAAAEVRPLLGSETVIAARLEGRQPAVITVRTCLAAKAITHEWRAVDTWTAQIYALKEIPRDGMRGFIEILAETGVAA